MGTAAADSIPGEGHRNGRRQIPPMRQAGALRKRPDDLLHPPRRRIRAHVLPPLHSRQAPHLGRSRRGKPQGQQGRVHGQVQGPVQATKHGEQRRDLRSRPRRCRYPKIQSECPANQQEGEVTRLNTRRQREVCNMLRTNQPLSGRSSNSEAVENS